MYSKILKNTGFLAFVRLCQPIFSLLLVIAIARSGGTKFLGGFAIVLSYLAIFQTFATFGLKYLLTRQVAEDHDATSRYFLHASLFSLPIGIVCAFAMYGVTAMLGYESSIRLSIGIAGFVLIATTLIENCEGVFIGRENIGPYAIVCFFENLLRIILSIAAIAAGFELAALIAIFAFTRFLAFGTNLLLLKKTLLSIPLNIDISFGFQLLKSAKTFALIVILATIYSRADILILSKIKGTNDVGIYSAAFRFIAAAQLLLASFSNSLYPHLTKVYQQSANRFKFICSEVIKRLVSLVAPFIILAVLLAEHIITFIFGSEFKDSIAVFQILTLSLFPFAFITVGDYILLSSHNQRLDLKINLYSVICIVTLNLVLIPVWGTMGAAIAMLSSTVIYFIIQYYFLSKFLFRINLYSIFSKPAIAAGIMAAVFVLTQNIHTVLAVVFSFAIYAAIIFNANQYLIRVPYILKRGNDEND